MTLEKLQYKRICIECKDTILLPNLISRARARYCKTCAVLNNRRLSSKYRETYPEFTRTCSREHYWRNRDKKIAQMRQYRQTHPEKLKQLRKRYYEENKTTLKLQRRIRYQRNINKERAQCRKYRADHLEELRAKNRIYMRKKRQERRYDS